MNPVLVGALSVLWIGQSDLKDLCLVENLMMEAEDFLIFMINRVVCWRHDSSTAPKKNVRPQWPVLQLLRASATPVLVA